jgi:hypothetical protein
VQGAGEAQALRVAQGADVTLKALTPSGLHPPRARALPLGPAVARADLAMKPVEEPVEVRGEAGGSSTATISCGEAVPRGLSFQAVEHGLGDVATGGSDRAGHRRGSRVEGEQDEGEGRRQQGARTPVPQRSTEGAQPVHRRKRAQSRVGARDRPSRSRVPLRGTATRAVALDYPGSVPCDSRGGIRSRRLRG